MKKIVWFLLLFLLIFNFFSVHAKLNSTVKENKKNYGKVLSTVEYSEGREEFSGKVNYALPNTDWEVEVLYVNGMAYSETARPNLQKSNKKIIPTNDANLIADSLFPKEERGSYRKQVNNAHFISHFFNNGVISYEMKLDEQGKNHIGVQGVRVLLYREGPVFNSQLTMVNAYH